MAVYEGPLLIDFTDRPRSNGRRISGRLFGHRNKIDLVGTAMLKFSNSFAFAADYFRN